jgi:F420-0:gamma-glutamyl ligase-like protein
VGLFSFLRFRAVKTKYWRPGENYLQDILVTAQKYSQDGDILAISEKALSVAKGNVVDESKATAGLLATILVKFVMRFLWGQFLGRLCHFKEVTLSRLRNYPLKEGAAHKQVVMQHAGFFQALKYGSEGGIDMSNLPYSYACLPLPNPHEEAIRIQKAIKANTNLALIVVISDTDSTFSYRNFHFTSRPNPLRGITSFGGAIAFVVGRAFKLKQRATPLAVAGSAITVEEALKIAEVAHHARGSGAGRTVWDMTRRFDVTFSSITWALLEKVDHYPLVLIRKKVS